MARQLQRALTILRRKEVERRTGLPRSSIYRKMSEGEFPEQVQLGPRSVGWVESEIDAWIVARVEVSRTDPTAVPVISETTRVELETKQTSENSLSTKLLCYPPKLQSAPSSRGTGSHPSSPSFSKGGRGDE